MWSDNLFAAMALLSVLKWVILGVLVAVAGLYELWKKRRRDREK